MEILLPICFENIRDENRGVRPSTHAEGVSGSYVYFEVELRTKAKTISCAVMVTEPNARNST